MVFCPGTGGASFREFDERMSGGAFSETETFEDFTRLDYLGSMREKIERLLGGSSRAVYIVICS